MTETLTALCLVLAAILLAGGIAGCVYLGWTMVNVSRAMEQSVGELRKQGQTWEVARELQQMQQLKFADETLKLLRDAMVELNKSMGAVHEAAGIVVEQVQKMYQRKEAGQINGVRPYQRPSILADGNSPPASDMHDPNAVEPGEAPPVPPWHPSWRAAEQAAEAERVALENDSWERGL